MRRGPDGTLHFSNCPMGADWKLYAKEKARTGPDTHSIRSTQHAPRYSKSQYDNIISHIARDQGMNPTLIKGIIEVESGYDPHGQVLQGRHGAHAAHAREQPRTLVLHDPWNPTENITAGTKYHLLAAQKVQRQPHEGPGCLQCRPGCGGHLWRNSTLPRDSQIMLEVSLPDYMGEDMQGNEHIKCTDRLADLHGPGHCACCSSMTAL
ncbi:MAG: lytic transglycosylase domain-containing protein [Desulfobacterales bacterium]|nr:lytic transglycosylase domain-containing protein [Desulfobacterales bacterium]